MDGAFINNASGNGFGAVSYPATDPNVMAVGSTDHNDERAASSNFGPELEVVAPGVDVLSTQPGDSYDTSSGTSFASPHVAGLAALMYSVNPAASNAEVRGCITQTAEDEVGDPAKIRQVETIFMGLGELMQRLLLTASSPTSPRFVMPMAPMSQNAQGQLRT